MPFKAAKLGAAHGSVIMARRLDVATDGRSAALRNKVDLYLLSFDDHPASMAFDQLAIAHRGLCFT